MDKKILIRDKGQFYEGTIERIDFSGLKVIFNRTLVNNFIYDIKLPHISGERILKVEVQDFEQLKLRTYSIEFKFLDLTKDIFKLIQKTVVDFRMKKFELAVARAVSAVLEKVLKNKIENIQYKIEKISEYKFENSIVVGVIGEISGSAIMSFESETQKILAKSMWSFDDMELDDSAIIDALKEFVNFVLGRTVTILSNNMGIKSDIKAPSIINNKFIKETEELKLNKVDINFINSEKKCLISLVFLTKK